MLITPPSKTIALNENKSLILFSSFFLSHYRYRTSFLLFSPEHTFGIPQWTLTLAYDCEKKQNTKQTKSIGPVCCCIVLWIIDRHKAKVHHQSHCWNELLINTTEQQQQQRHTLFSICLIIKFNTVPFWDKSPLSVFGVLINLTRMQDSFILFFVWQNISISSCVLLFVIGDDTMTTTDWKKSLNYSPFPGD